MATAVGLVVIPDAINHLIVKHTPDLGIDKALAIAETPIAGLARWAGSGLLLAVSTIVVLLRGHPNRDISWLLVFLLALNLPYVIGPVRPGPADLVKIVLANVVLLAIWNTGARVSQLKWIPILLACVGAYSLVGGLIIPDYMMYNMVSRKSLVAGWELAGPFGQSNALGMYCAIAFSLVPLIARNRWRVTCAVILLATIVASATRTALVAAGVVIIWWALTRLRSVVSTRVLGTTLAGAALSAALIMPLLDWSADSFTDRAFIWSGGLDIWQQSPVVGQGFSWFLTGGQEHAEIVVWAGAGTGHNILIDTLVKYGLAGVALLMPIWIGAIVASRANPVPREQIACFGYLIAFFIMAITEAVWDLWPNTQQFPTSALIFATVILARRGDQSGDRSGDKGEV
ncbi:O-antigen ligase family protein [Mycolicibacterium sp. S2-37]|nr:O-antigen ligase family protein [Mycolicibacterium sp. S2-37]